MKPRALYPALLIAGLFASCNSGNPASETTAETTVLTDTTLAAAPPADDCNGKPLPASCENSCETDACYKQVLKDHEIPDLTGYEKDGAPFIYKDPTFGGLLQNAICTSRFVFSIFQKRPGGPWYSIVSMDTAKHPNARSFPAPLIKAIERQHKADMASMDFYWLKKSPQCPAGNDVLIDVVLRGGKHAYYDLSLPPEKITAAEAEKRGLLNKGIPQGNPAADK